MPVIDEVLEFLDFIAGIISSSGKVVGTSVSVIFGSIFLGSDATRSAVPIRVLASAFAYPFGNLTTIPPVLDFRQLFRLILKYFLCYWWWWWCFSSFRCRRSDY